jgi:hypothetical protein
MNRDNCEVERMVVMPRIEVKKFAEAMELQLKRNEYKGEWNTCTYGFLLKELDKNLNELKEIMENPGGNIAEIRENLKDIKRRTTNIANFCMMICDNSGAIDKIMADAVNGVVE